MGFPENEVAADNQRREFEELSRVRWSRLFGQFSVILKWKVCFSV
jgi:hypothetical protein